MADMKSNPLVNNEFFAARGFLRKPRIAVGYGIS